jgi:pimeloyl-ACP methyl ester carboxylesterase
MIEKAGLVGHSDGGTMALCLAAHRPERVGALIAAAAHIYVEQSMLPGVVAVGKAFTHDAESREKLVRAHGAKVDRVFRSCPEGRAQLRHLDWDLRPVLQFVACPVFVVQGEEDECATPQRALDLAAGLRRGRVVGPRRRAYGSPGSPQEFNRRALEFLEDEKRVER